MTKVYQAIASVFQAYENCSVYKKDQHWIDMAMMHEDRIDKLVEAGPSGSGFDNGIQLIKEESTPNKLVFQADYHHMNEFGMYCGWSENKIIVTPSLVFGIEIDVESDFSGVDSSDHDPENDKDYFAETFEYWLNSEEQ